ncbi:MAG: tail fiber domain-containing protein [Pseudomonadota bacterium]
MRKTIVAGLAGASLLAASAASADSTRNPAMSAKRVAHAANESSSGLLAGDVMILLTGAVLLGLVQVGGGTSSMMTTTMAASDARLKTDITRTGTSPSGIPVYSFRYGDAPDVYTGVMAQDLLERAPEAIVPLKRGYYAVDYSKIDVEFALSR